MPAQRALLLLALGLAAVPSFASPTFQHRCRQQTDRFSSAEGGCKHLPTGLVWSLKAAERLNHRDAAEYCAKLVDAVWKDWRLPTVDELGDVAKAEAREHFRFSTNDGFWAQDSSNAAGAHTVLLSSGEELYRNKGELNATICVRSGSRPRFGCRANDEHFTTMGGGCADLHKRLVWSTPPEYRLTWERAGDYCSRYGSAGFSGWRLPTEAELLGVAGRHLGMRYLQPGPDEQYQFWSSRQVRDSGYGCGDCHVVWYVSLDSLLSQYHVIYSDA